MDVIVCSMVFKRGICAFILLSSCTACLVSQGHFTCARRWGIRHEMNTLMNTVQNKYGIVYTPEPDMISYRIDNEAVILLNEVKLTAWCFQFRLVLPRKTASLSIWYEIISDSSVYTISYLFCTVFISVFISCRIPHRLRVNKRPIQYKNLSDSFESDIVLTGSYLIAPLIIFEYWCVKASRF